MRQTPYSALINKCDKAVLIIPPDSSYIGEKDGIIVQIMSAKQKITPFLWFNNQAEEAANYYVSMFRNSRVLKVTHYAESASKVSGRPKGSVMTVKFLLEGQEFVALNGGPHFKFTEAVSLVVNCRTQREVDKYWEKLSAGGKKGQCGWLKDKYGLSWQVFPEELGEMLDDPDPAKSDRVMEALIQMSKLDIGILRRAYKAGF
jgi:predicted 3-demethylubiquinone-9 3-methyltransferase (glyoxalase superfamily)